MSVTARFFCLLAMALAVALPGAARAQLSEAQAKVALLFNVITFIDWPKDLTQMRLCTIGADEFAGPLRSIEGAQVAGLPLRIRRLEAGESARGCQILFIGEQQASRIRKLVEDAGAGVLMVGDGQDSIALGVAVGIGLEKQRVAFNVNQTAARAAGIHISSKLLRLAGTVR